MEETVAILAAVVALDPEVIAVSLVMSTSLKMY